MNILQMIDNLNIGGSERMAVNISNVLAKNGNHVVLCASREKGALTEFVDDEVKLICLNKKKAWDVFAFRRFLKIIKDDQVELIHAHSSSVFWAAAAKKFYPNIKLIWHDHLGDEGKLNPERKKGVQRISGKIDGIIAVNEKLKIWSQQFTKVKDENVVYIPNFPLLKEPKIQKNNSDKKLKIVCLGNLRWQKGHPDLLKAISIIEKKSPGLDYKLIVAGGYRQDDYYLGLQKFIKENQLEEKIEFTGSVTDTSRLLYNCDIGVLSSVSEGLPVSLLEYGLASLPVVVTDVGQCAEVVDFGKAGLVVPSENPEAMATALTELLKNEEKRKDFSQKFKERTETVYGSKNFLKLYHQLISGI
ncbi:MAG: glycosyltransferase family 4 protein [Moheibacter sp.]